MEDLRKEDIITRLNASLEDAGRPANLLEGPAYIAPGVIARDGAVSHPAPASRRSAARPAAAPLLLPFRASASATVSFKRTINFP